MSVFSICGLGARGGLEWMRSKSSLSAYGADIMLRTDPHVVHYIHALTTACVSYYVREHALTCFVSGLITCAVSTSCRKPPTGSSSRFRTVTTTLVCWRMATSSRLLSSSRPLPRSIPLRLPKRAACDDGLLHSRGGPRWVPWRVRTSFRASYDCLWAVRVAIMSWMPKTGEGRKRMASTSDAAWVEEEACFYRDTPTMSLLVQQQHGFAYLVQRRPPPMAPCVGNRVNRSRKLCAMYDLKWSIRYLPTGLPRP